MYKVIACVQDISIDDMGKYVVTLQEIGTGKVIVGKTYVDYFHTGQLVGGEVNMLEKC